MTASHNGINLKDSPLAQVRGGLDLCVHCGFCLQACPTYLALEDENDSPRGRIVLMHALLDGDVPPTDSALQTHISRCLGCRGCETACPSGVPFGHLLEATRATLREHQPVPVIARIILAVFARPTLLAIVMTFARAIRATGLARLLAHVPGRLGTANAMLAATAPPRFTAAHGSARARNDATSTTAPVAKKPPGHNVVLFEGCVMRELYGHVHEASRSTLERNGHTMKSAAAQRCCGALHAHTGDLEKARELARINIVAFEQNPEVRIVVNAAGCGAMLKEYPALFEAGSEWDTRARAFSARVQDINELLEQSGPLPGAKLNVTAAYNAPCHLQHAQRITTAPLAVLTAVPGLVVVQPPGSDKCCGAAGIYNLIEPATSAAVLAPKMEEISSTNADFVCTANPGCMMQIGAALIQSGSRMQIAHPVELLDYSYRVN